MEKNLHQTKQKKIIQQKYSMKNEIKIILMMKTTIVLLCFFSLINKCVLNISFDVVTDYYIEIALQLIIIMIILHEYLPHKILLSD